MQSKEITSRVHSIKNVSLKKISELSMAKQNLETVSRRLTERSKRVSRVSKSQNIYQVSTFFNFRVRVECSRIWNRKAASMLVTNIRDGICWQRSFFSPKSYFDLHVVGECCRNIKIDVGQLFPLKVLIESS